MKQFSPCSLPWVASLALAMTDVKNRCEKQAEVRMVASRTHVDEIQRSS
jgi:hypothetical protein